MTNHPISTHWVKQTIAAFMASAEENHLADFHGQEIYDTAIVGIVDGDDPLFERFKEAVSEHHLVPRQVLAHSFPDQPAPESVSVISWALPFKREIRESNRSGEWPSRLYSVARNNGGALNFSLRKHLVDALCRQSVQAVSPQLALWYDAFKSETYTYSSNWSERHVAYAAGLGRFGLSAGLITPVGVCTRLGSVVAGISLDPTARRHDDYRAECLINGGADCGHCIERCPVGAISSKGHDKQKCNKMRKAVRTQFLEDIAGSMHLLTAPIATSGQRRDGYSLGCALCQCGVPCESSDPYSAKRNEAR